MSSSPETPSVVGRGLAAGGAEDRLLLRSVRWTAVVVLAVGVAAAVVDGAVAAANFVLGGALSLGLLKVLQLCAGRWRRRERVSYGSMLALLLPKYALIAVLLWLAVRAESFRPGWFLGGFLVLHCVWLLQAALALGDRKTEHPS